MGKVHAVLHVAVALSVALSVAIGTLGMPGPEAHAQEYSDNRPTLVAVVGGEYVFLNDSGHGVMVGTVENQGTSPISGVHLQVRFYDEASAAPLDVVSGRTLVDVLPPSSKAPFMIASSEPNTLITEASARIVSFDSSPAKAQSLDVRIDDIVSDIVDYNTNAVTIRGTITNVGAAPSSDAAVHVAFHDAFEPPRILHVGTVLLAGTMEPGQAAGFVVTEIVSSRAHGFTIHVESDIFLSPASESRTVIDLPQPSEDGGTLVYTKALATITGVSVRDGEDGGGGDPRVGHPASITTDVRLQLAEDAPAGEVPYSVYVQIKESASSVVEFIARYDGTFEGPGVQQSALTWVPQRPGLYIAETFVWGADGVPIGNQGPVSLVLVN